MVSLFSRTVYIFKVEKIWEDSLNLISSPSVKFKLLADKFTWGNIAKHCLGDVNKHFVFKSLLTATSNVLPLHLKQTFLPKIWIFIEGKDDRIKFRPPFKVFPTLIDCKVNSYPGISKIWQLILMILFLEWPKQWHRLIRGRQWSTWRWWWWDCPWGSGFKPQNCCN